MNIKMKSNRSKTGCQSKTHSIQPVVPIDKKKRKHKGFSRHHQITHGDGCQTGTMVCDNCHKPIGKEPYMVVEYYDMHSRGNENDFNKIYHRQCCERSYPHSWTAYDEKIKQTAIKTARRNRMITRLQKIIVNWNFESWELFPDD